MESTYFRRGFGLKAEIEGQLTADYHSTVVEAFRARNYRLDVGHMMGTTGTTNPLSTLLTWRQAFIACAPST